MTMMRKRNLDHDLEAGGGNGGGGPTPSRAPSGPSPLYAHSSAPHLPLVPSTPPSRSTVCYLALLSVLLASYAGFTSVSNSSLREDLLAAERSYANLHAQQKSAHAKEIDALTGANTDLGGRAKRTEDDLVRVKSLLEERDADARDKTEKIAGLEDDLATAKRDLDDERAHVDTVEGELDDMKEKKEDLEDEKEELDEKVATLEAENAVLKAALEEAAREKVAGEKEDKKKERDSLDALLGDAGKDKVKPDRKDGDNESASGDASADEPDGDGVHGYPKLPQHKDDGGDESDRAKESLPKPRSDGSLDENEDEGEVTGGGKISDDLGIDGGSDKASGKDDGGGAFLEADTAKGAADAADLDLGKIRDEEKAAAALAADAAHSKGGFEDSDEDEGEEKRLVDTPDETAKTGVQAKPSESRKGKESDDDDDVDDESGGGDDDDNTDAGDSDETKDVEKDTYLGGKDQTPAVKVARQAKDPFAQVGDSPVNDESEGAKAASASQDVNDENEQDGKGKYITENGGGNAASKDEGESGTKNNIAQSKPMRSGADIKEKAKSKALALDSDNPSNDAAASKASKGKDGGAERMKGKSKSEKRNEKIKLDDVAANGDSKTVINADDGKRKRKPATNEDTVEKDRDKTKKKLHAEKTENKSAQRKENDKTGINAAVVKKTK